MRPGFRSLNLLGVPRATISINPINLHRNHPWPPLEVLRSCPALLQGFLASCRSHGGVGSCEGGLDSCVAVLHHVALARQYDVELCRLVTTAWMRRETWTSLWIWGMLHIMFYHFLCMLEVMSHQVLRFV